MKFCSQCGAGVALRVPEGDTLPRHVCDACQTIHYLNPKIVAGCIPEWEERILLCRRAIEPRTGLWTFPAGFMETGESTEQAALRETFEEAGTEVDHASLYAVLSLPHISQVYMVFRATMRTPAFRPGAESLEARFFLPDDIPWESLAFPVVREALERYVEDVKNGSFGLHVLSVSSARRF